MIAEYFDLILSSALLRRGLIIFSTPAVFFSFRFAFQDSFIETSRVL